MKLQVKTAKNAFFKYLQTDRQMMLLLCTITGMHSNNFTEYASLDEFINLFPQYEDGEN